MEYLGVEVNLVSVKGDKLLQLAVRSPVCYTEEMLGRNPTSFADLLLHLWPGRIQTSRVLILANSYLGVNKSFFLCWGWHHHLTETHPFMTCAGRNQGQQCLESGGESFHIMLINKVFEIQTVSHIWVFRITPAHLYAETTVWMYKQSFQMRMSLPNREKHIQVKCQIELCRITVLVHTAFREAA